MLHPEGLAALLCPPCGGARTFSAENRDPQTGPSQRGRPPSGGWEAGTGMQWRSPPPMEMFLDKLMVSGTLGVRGEGGGQANSSSPALAAE